MTTRAHHHLVRWLLVAVTVLGGAVFLWLVWPSQPEVPPWIRVRVRPSAAVCDSMDIELDFEANTAKVRSWFPVMGGTVCNAPARAVTLTSDQRKLARAGARALAGTSLPRALISGTWRDERTGVQLEKGEVVQSTAARTFEGVRPPGVDELEKLYAELTRDMVEETVVTVAPGAAAPGRAAPAGAAPPVALRVSDPSRADLQEVLASLQADAVRKVPGAGLSELSVVLERGGDIDLTSQSFLATFAIATRSVTYRVDRGQVKPSEPSSIGSDSTLAVSRCSSRDLWRKAIAAGMPDAPQARLTLSMGPSAGGGIKTIWQFWAHRGGPLRGIAFDATTCALEPR